LDYQFLSKSQEKEFRESGFLVPFYDESARKMEWKDNKIYGRRSKNIQEDKFEMQIVGPHSSFTVDMLWT
jgi:hypothetical protein